MTDNVLEERQTADGRRRIQLNAEEREEIVRQRNIEGAVALFLDLEEKRTYDEIAAELGISRDQLKRLTQTEEFEAVYNDHFLDLAHDPRLKATKAAIVDLLPDAFHVLRRLLVNPETADTVRFKAMEKVFDMAGVKPTNPAISDRRELAEFLRQAGFQQNNTQNNIENVNLQLPDGYNEALDEVESGEVRGEDFSHEAEDGDFRELGE